MNRSEAIGTLVGALAKAQADFLPVTKDRTAKITSPKGNFQYAYADLGDAIAATRAALTKNGLAVVQPMRVTETGIVVTTVIAHSSGEWMSEECEWPVPSGDARAIGSGITYARRYGYLAMCGAAAVDDDDDDGDAAVAAPPRPRPQAAPVRTVTARNGDAHREVGPTGEQGTEIKACLLALGVREKPGEYLKGIISDAETVDDYAQVLVELRKRVIEKQRREQAMAEAERVAAGEQDPAMGDR